MALPATWDASTSVPVPAVIAIIGLVALLVLVHRAHGRVPAAGPAAHGAA